MIVKSDPDADTKTGERLKGIYSGCSGEWLAEEGSGSADGLVGAQSTGRPRLYRGI